MVTHEGRVIYKVNQDRGLISHPSLSEAQHTMFGIFDGERLVMRGFRGSRVGVRSSRAICSCV